MKSKWLEWIPELACVGFEGSRSAVSPITRGSDRDRLPILGPSPDAITEKVVNGEPTKPTERTSVVRDEPFAESLSYFWGKHGDAYGWRMHAALDAICEIPAPAGLVIWLSERSPVLYRRLTNDLPNDISRAWSDRVPHEDFDALCFDLVDTYRRAAELYSATARSGRK